MDRVRFGRALGKGARLAARTAMEAADAAVSSPPATPASGRRSSSPITPGRPTQRPVLLPPLRVGTAVRAGSRSVLAPLRRASQALWHELTGSFFALFALSFGLSAWHTRAHRTDSLPEERFRFFAFCALALLFLYFSVSSFLRARSQKAS